MTRSAQRRSEKRNRQKIDERVECVDGALGHRRAECAHHELGKDAPVQVAEHGAPGEDGDREGGVAGKARRADDAAQLAEPLLRQGTTAAATAAYTSAHKGRGGGGGGGGGGDARARAPHLRGQAEQREADDQAHQRARATEEGELAVGHGWSEE